MKDVWWADKPMPVGVFGGHVNFGDRRRCWDFRSVGRGKIDFDAIIRALNAINYCSPLSVEWEDSGMDRCYGAGSRANMYERLILNPLRLHLTLHSRKIGF